MIPLQVTVWVVQGCAGRAKARVELLAMTHLYTLVHQGANYNKVAPLHLHPSSAVLFLSTFAWQVRVVTESVMTPPCTCVSTPNSVLLGLVFVVRVHVMMKTHKSVATMNSS